MLMTRVNIIIGILAMVFLLDSCSQKEIKIDTSETCNCVSQVSTAVKSRKQYERKINNCFHKLNQQILDSIQKYQGEVASSTIISTGYSNLYACQQMGKHRELLDSLRNTVVTTNIEDKSTCSILKSGKFKIASYDEEILINQTDQTQFIRYPERNNTYERSTVKWIDECSYYLIFEETDDVFVRDVYKKGDTSTIRLLEISNDTITYERTSLGLKEIGQMVKY